MKMMSRAQLLSRTASNSTLSTQSLSNNSSFSSNCSIGSSALDDVFAEAPISEETRQSRWGESSTAASSAVVLGATSLQNHSTPPSSSASSSFRNIPCLDVPLRVIPRRVVSPANSGTSVGSTTNRTPRRSSLPELSSKTGTGRTAPTFQSSSATTLARIARANPITTSNKNRQQQQHYHQQQQYKKKLSRSSTYPQRHPSPPSAATATATAVKSSNQILALLGESDEEEDHIFVRRTQSNKGLSEMFLPRGEYDDDDVYSVYDKNDGYNEDGTEETAIMSSSSTTARNNDDDDITTTTTTTNASRRRRHSVIGTALMDGSSSNSTDRSSSKNDRLRNILLVGDLVRALDEEEDDANRCGHIFCSRRQLPNYMMYASDDDS